VLKVIKTLKRFGKSCDLEFYNRFLTKFHINNLKCTSARMVRHDTYLLKSNLDVLTGVTEDWRKLHNEELQNLYS
jgi:hypothetical protein